MLLPTNKKMFEAFFGLSDEVVPSLDVLTFFFTKVLALIFV